LKTNGLYGIDTMDVSIGRQQEGKLFGLHFSSGTFVGVYYSLHRAKRQVAENEKIQRTM
jgi:hypothetical protein